MVLLGQNWALPTWPAGAPSPQRPQAHHVKWSQHQAHTTDIPLAAPVLSKLNLFCLHSFIHTLIFFFALQTDTPPGLLQKDSWPCSGALLGDDQQQEIKRGLQKQTVGDLYHTFPLASQMCMFWHSLHLCFLKSQWKTPYKARIRQFNLQKFYITESQNVCPLQGTKKKAHKGRMQETLLLYFYHRVTEAEGQIQQ